MIYRSMLIKIKTMKSLILLPFLFITLLGQSQDTTAFMTANVNSICVGDTAQLAAGTVGADYGNGSDGALNVTSGTAYTDNVRTSITGTNAVGSSTLNVTSSTGFSVGDEIMIITMVDAATSNNVVGQHEFNIISGISGNAITLTTTLTYAYTASSTKKHQVLKVSNYTSVTIGSGVTLTCHTWNGTSGGVLAFRANGNVTNSGSITASEKGYRGFGHAAAISGNAHRRNMNGAQGEGIYGTGYAGGASNGSNTATWNGANGNGGGGGTGRGDSGGGAGGGYAANGTNGQNWGAHNGGTGGKAAGAANLSKLIMGGAGGEGGGDEDGHLPGAGGNGGGIVLISCANLTNNGNLTANGENGENGTNSNPKGSNGGGCGMAGGGGGAGGSIKIIALFNSASGTIESLAGKKGTSNGCGGYGGDGSVGRIALASTSTTFPTTTPTSSTASLTVITGSAYKWNTGDTAASIKVSPSTTTTYTVTVSNGNWADTLSQGIFVFTTPNLPVIANQEHCTGKFTFNASTDSLVETLWYSSRTGGTPIHYGNEFTTPTLTDTTTYYVSSRYIPYTPPADKVDNTLDLALGLRLLSSSYKGNAVILRKSATANDTLSFGFTSFGQLDVDSINRWAGSTTTLYVHTIYDQSGKGRNLSNTTTSQQPTLARSGVNGKPVLRFTTGKFLRFTSNVFTYPMSIVTAAKLTSNSCNRVFGASNNYIWAFYGNQVNWHHFNNGWTSNSSTNRVSAKSSDTWIHSSMSASSSSHRFFDNGNEWPTNTIGTGGTQPPNGFQLNGYNGNRETSNADIMEVFIFSNTITDTERKYIEGRIASQYNWQTAGGQFADLTAGCLLSNSNRDSVTAFVTEPSFGISADTVSVNCGLDKLTIDAGAGWNTYSWSNLDTTRICTALFSGKYKVVVSDGLCNLEDTVFVSIPQPKLEDFRTCVGDTISAGYSALGGFASGGVLDTAGGTSINKFLTNGTLVFPSTGTVRALIVAGGGGGGMDMGGGGGAGGFIDTTFTLSAGTYNITVGQGGTGAPAAGTNGQPSNHRFTIPALNGGNSSIGSILTAIGGGAGGSSYINYTPKSGGNAGGSGGGHSGYSGPNGTGGGLGTAGQGNRGGHGGGSYRSGGGGGAGAIGGGGPAGGSYNANGGAGLQSNILGTTYYFAGGGGGSGYSENGGNGGIGGGGGGAVGSTTGGAGLNNGSAGGGGTRGTQTNKPGGDAGANTGGGGGGGSHYNSNNKGGIGGSGMVVISYTPILSYEFTWSTGDSTAVINVSPSQTTDYYVTITDGISTCYDTMTVFVTVPSYTFANDSVAYCGVNTAAVYAGTGWSKYVWDQGDSLQQSTVSSSGMYYVTVTDSTGCSANDSIYVSLIDSEILQGDTTICSGTSLTISTRTTNVSAYNYAWSTGDTTLTTTVSPTQTTTYYVTTTDGVGMCIDTIIVTIPSPTSTDVHTACDAFTWINGVTYTTSNTTAVDTLVNVAGCDSLVTLDLTINRSSTASDVHTACNVFTWIDGVTYTASNNRAMDTLVNRVGCDSVVTLDLTINYLTTATDVHTVCDAFTWIDGVTYTASNTSAKDTLVNKAGCDSMVTLDLTIKYSSSATDTHTACDAFTWIDGITYTASNTSAQDTLVNNAGCDSVVTLDLTINRSSSATDTHTACDAFTWIDGVTYTASNTTAIDTLVNTAGCDSVVTLDLTINYSTSATDTHTACNAFTWIDGVIYTSSNTTALDTLVNDAGCDSVVTLDLTINYSNSATDTHTACDAFTWIDGVTYTASNTSASDTLVNTAGCDSIVTLDLTIRYSTSATDTHTACDEFTWIDGITYTASNTSASDTLINTAGCDSVITLDLTINRSNSATDIHTACSSFTWIDGITYTTSNTTAIDTLVNTAGCDSIVTLDLTVNYSNSATDTHTACNAFTWIDGVTYTASNTTAIDTLVNDAGCDSLVTLDLTIKYSTSATDTHTACDVFTWIDGVTYTASNTTAIDTLVNTAGCDSIVTLDLTIRYSTSATDTHTACDEFTWIDGITYTTSNTSAIDTLLNTAGCDSVVTLDLTIKRSNSATDKHTACSSFTWIDGITYTTSNTTAIDTLVNNAGCDSVITLDLTINYSTSVTDTHIVCDAFTWIDGITYTASNTTAIDTLVNTAGCDSLVTLALTIKYSTSATDTHTACDAFTWIDGVTYTASNTAAKDTLVNTAGCDSVVTLDLTIRYSTAATDTHTACDEFTWIDGITYTTSNTSAIDTLLNTAGCDSVVTLDLTINYSTTAIDIQTACDTFIWINGVTYTSSDSTAKDTLVTLSGCDSIVSLKLTITTINKNVSTSEETLTVSESGAQYQWMVCENNYTIVDGEIGQSFTAAANGLYAVEITKDGIGCIDTSICSNVKTVGVIQTVFNGPITIYPNPTTGKLNIDAVNFEDVEVYDTSGRLIIKSELTTISLEEQSKGLYILKVSANGTIQEFKVFKE